MSAGNIRVFKVQNTWEQDLAAVVNRHLSPQHALALQATQKPVKRAAHVPEFSGMNHRQAIQSSHSKKEELSLSERTEDLIQVYLKAVGDSRRLILSSEMRACLQEKGFFRCVLQRDRLEDGALGSAERVANDFKGVLIDFIDALYAYRLQFPHKTFKHDRQDQVLSLCSEIQAKIEQYQGSTDQASLIQELRNCVASAAQGWQKGVSYEAALLFLMRSAEPGVPQFNLSVEELSPRFSKDQFKSNFRRTILAAEQYPERVPGFLTWLATWLKAAVEGLGARLFKSKSFHAHMDQAVQKLANELEEVRSSVMTPRTGSPASLP